MAKKYENVEKITSLLEDAQLGGLQKRLLSTEKSLSGILKKLADLEITTQTCLFEGLCTTENSMGSILKKTT